MIGAGGRGEVDATPSGAPQRDITAGHLPADGNSRFTAPAYFAFEEDMASKVPASFAIPDRSFAPQFEHHEECTTHLSAGEVREGWQGIVDRHLISPLREADPRTRAEVDVRGDRRFHGRMRSGRIGPLRYCRVWASHGRLTQQGLPHGPQRHVLALIVSGQLRYEFGAVSLQAEPGDFILVRNLRHVAIEHDEPIETVVLYDALQSHALGHFGNQAVVRRAARSDAAAMASRWIQDSCADRGWQSGLAADSMAHAVQALAAEVMHERPVATRLRVDRASIERQVAHRLDDPTLSLGELADSFHCSIRTLHRVFRRDGEESLERYIQQQRIEACAVRLRSHGSEPALSLTELALRFGFSSSSHFSNAFKAQFGMSPSTYRKVRGES